MRFDGQDPSLVPLEAVRATGPLPAAAPHLPSDPQTLHGEEVARRGSDHQDETTLVAARSRATDQSSHDEHDTAERGPTTTTAAESTTGPLPPAKTWHHMHPIFAHKARGIRTRALRFVSRARRPDSSKTRRRR